MNKVKLLDGGGEEFLVLLPDSDLVGALAIANKLRIAIQYQPFKNCPSSLQVTVIGGVLQVMPIETFEIIFKRVDTTLYKGKNAGENCIYG
ncbi:MAG: diguanylate cyclase (GGDEF)-like protein [Alphaproteobacteria bacterium]